MHGGLNERQETNWFLKTIGIAVHGRDAMVLPVVRAIQWICERVSKTVLTMAMISLVFVSISICPNEQHDNTCYTDTGIYPLFVEYM